MFNLNPKDQKFYGRVDCGHDINSDTVDEASQCLVLLVTSINGSWKLPIGYFLIVSLTGEQKTILVQTALQLCHDAGIKVASVTCESRPVPVGLLVWPGISACLHLWAVMY